MYNVLKLDNNVKGRIAEEIAIHLINRGVRCKTRNSNIIDEFPIKEELRNFLKKYWYYFDIIRFNEVNRVIEIYEVKSRKWVRDRKAHWKKYAINPYCLEMYKTAIKNGMVVRIFDIAFLSNWNFSYTIKLFDEKLFSVSKSRGQGSNKRG
tara:strand:+ start:3152 stop:3604 length:453 start_codon:yes stop_codon:yes gene_type:complete